MNTEVAFSELNQSEIVQLKKSEENKIDQFIRASASDIKKVEDLLEFKLKDHSHLMN